MTSRKRSGTAVEQTMCDVTFIPEPDHSDQSPNAQVTGHFFVVDGARPPDST
jgi:hypothetical protein